MLFAAVATVTVFSSAGDRLDPSNNGQGATLADLAAAGGDTKAFAVGASFAVHLPAVPQEVSADERVARAS